MEEQVNALTIKVESLVLQVEALKAALVNIVGFYVDNADGSQQGLIKFGAAPVQVEATPIGGAV